jgi:FixJ family two-component response regulator
VTADALVLVVDDDPSVRKAVSRALRTAGHAVETFASAGRLLQRLPAIAVPCCLVSDIRMPGLNGLALQQDLRGRGAPVAVVFLTEFADIPTTVQAMKNGAVDLLQKPVGGRELLSAVAAALTRARDEVENRRRRAALLSRYELLTPRERQVFALVASGLANKRVGLVLGTSEKTIKVQRARVIEKMGARSLAELVRMADRLALAPSAGRDDDPPAEASVAA